MGSSDALGAVQAKQGVSLGVGTVCPVDVVRLRIRSASSKPHRTSPSMKSTENAIRGAGGTDVVAQTRRPDGAESPDAPEHRQQSGLPLLQRRAPCPPFVPPARRQPPVHRLQLPAADATGRQLQRSLALEPNVLGCHFHAQPSPPSTGLQLPSKSSPASDNSCDPFTASAYERQLDCGWVAYGRLRRSRVGEATSTLAAWRTSSSPQLPRSSSPYFTMCVAPSFLRTSRLTDFSLRRINRFCCAF